MTFGLSRLGVVCKAARSSIIHPAKTCIGCIKISHSVIYNGSKRCHSSSYIKCKNNVATSPPPRVRLSNRTFDKINGLSDKQHSQRLNNSQGLDNNKFSRSRNTFPDIDPASSSEIQSVVDFLTRHKGNVTVLCGAGISTESGHPDYRTTSLTRRVQPMTHTEFVSSERMRQRYYARSFLAMERLAKLQPNEAHKSIELLYQSGVVKYISTQNVDGLQQQQNKSFGGNVRQYTTQDLVELHGSILSVKCQNKACGHQISRAQLQKLLHEVNSDWEGHRLLRDNTDKEIHFKPDFDMDLTDQDTQTFQLVNCHECKGGFYKPNVVFFGGKVDSDIQERVKGQIRNTTALLLLGTTVMTWSAFSKVKLAKELGNEICCIGHGKTRADEIIDFKVEGLLGPTLSQIANCFGNQV